jgi:hypothetical protein
MSVDISRAPEEVGEAYGAQGPHDIYLNIKPARALDDADQERLIAAVRATGRTVGGTCKSCVLVSTDISHSCQRRQGKQGGPQALCEVLEEQGVRWVSDNKDIRRDTDEVASQSARDFMDA